ncbi:RNA-binding protein MEX3B-like [Homarus americanus]|uniref:RNA-binding protein MEX3B-like n=1 Tax=Homarus americanus TaxID=6706 RepID=A0A8J5K7Y9_HOMAM|nr:RNA-binding protein MEX3B-like [Homarus americanus]
MWSWNVVVVRERDRPGVVQLPSRPEEWLMVTGSLALPCGVPGRNAELRTSSSLHNGIRTYLRGYQTAGLRCKIKALRAKTNTYIKTPVRGEEPVFVVTGRKEDVGMAKREILSAAEHFSQIRACRKNNLNGSMAPGPPTNVPGQVTIQVRVPYRVVGLVVGPKGATIKRIQQQTHTYIVTPSRDKEPVFEVTGLPESVEQARKEIEAHIAMRTGGLLDQDEPNAAAAARHHGDFPPPSHGLDNLFSPASSELVSSLYKLNNSSLNGLASINGITNGTGLNGLTNGLSNGSGLNGITGLNGLSGNGLNNSLNGMNGLNNTLNSLNTLNQLNDLNSAFTLLGDAGSSLLGSSNKGGSALESSLFSSFSSGVGSGKLSSDVTGSGTGGLGLYGVDEGLGSLGSSMGSSPSFDPAPSSIWGELGRPLGNTMSSTVSSSSSLSSTFSSLSSTLSSSLTRRSSSVSGASPPSSRLSPSLEAHPPARRISSDPAPGLGGAPSLASLNSALTGGLGGLPTSSPSSSSPASTPDLTQQLNAFQSTTGLPSAPATSTSTTTITGISQLVNGIDEKKRCVTCCESEVVAALVPCGHNLFCLDCANKLVAEAAECPICRMKVTQAIRIFS